MDKVDERAHRLLNRSLLEQFVDDGIVRVERETWQTPVIYTVDDVVTHAEACLAAAMSELQAYESDGQSKEEWEAQLARQVSAARRSDANDQAEEGRGLRVNPFRDWEDDD